MAAAPLGHDGEGSGGNSLTPAQLLRQKLDDALDLAYIPRMSSSTPLSSPPSPVRRNPPSPETVVGGQMVPTKVCAADQAKSDT